MIILESYESSDPIILLGEDLYYNGQWIERERIDKFLDSLSISLLSTRMDCEDTTCL